MSDAFDKLEPLLGDKIERLDLDAKGDSITYLLAFDELLKKHLPKSYKSKRMRLNRFVELTASNPALKSDEDLVDWIQTLAYCNWPTGATGQDGRRELDFLESLAKSSTREARKKSERKSRLGRLRDEDGKFLKKNKEMHLLPAKRKIAEAHKRLVAPKGKFNEPLTAKPKRRGKK